MRGTVTVGGRTPFAAADSWLFTPGSAHALACARIVLASLLGIRIAFGPYRGLADQPAALFHPPPFLTWLDGVPSTWVLVTLQVIGTVAAGAAVVGWRARGSFRVAWGALLVLAGLRGSFGKILHNDVLLVLAAIPFLVAPLDARLGDRRRSPAWGFALRASAVVVAAAYVFCGLQKLRHTGISWVTSDNMRWIMDGAARSARSPAPDLARDIADTPWLATSLAAGLLAFELTFWLCVPLRQLRVVALAAAAALHAGTALLLGLDYWSWIVVDVAVLANWDAIVGGQRTRRA